MAHSIYEPDWRSWSSHAVACLVRPRSLLNGYHITWCGISIDSNYKPAPYAKRCKSCLAELRKYNELATTPPPERTTTTFTITVTAPVSAKVESQLADFLARKRSWEYEVVVVSEVPVVVPEPDSEVGQPQE